MTSLRTLADPLSLQHDDLVQLISILLHTTLSLDYCCSVVYFLGLNVHSTVHTVTAVQLYNYNLQRDGRLRRLRVN